MQSICQINVQNCKFLLNVIHQKVYFIFVKRIFVSVIIMSTVAEI